MKSTILILTLSASIAAAQPAPNAAAPAAAPSTQSDSTNPSQFEPFGVHITVPADWKRLPETQSNTIARWAVMKPGSATDVAVIVTADIEAAKGRTTEMAGNDFAKRVNGKSDPNAELAGTRAARVTGNLGTASAPKPVEALVTRQEEFVYTIAAAATEAGVAQTQALEDLRREFEFVPMTNPTEQVELRSQPVAVFHRFSIKLLTLLRPVSEQQQGRVELRVFNYRRGRADLVMTMELVNLQPRQTLQDLGNSLALGSGAKKEDVQWRELNGTPKRVISNTFKIPNRSLPIRIGLVRLSDKQAAMINFGLSAPDDLDRSIYDEKCAAMLESVELLKQ